MTPGIEQVAVIGRSQVDTALKLAAIASETLDKLGELNVKAAKTAVATGIKSIREIAGSRDATEFTALGSAWLQPVWERSQAYARDAYAVVAASQAEISALVEQQFAELNKNIAVALDAALKSAPMGSEAAAGAFKLAIQSANAVYEPILKASKQAAEANLSASAHAGSKRKAA